MTMPRDSQITSFFPDSLRHLNSIFSGYGKKLYFHNEDSRKELFKDLINFTFEILESVISNNFKLDNDIIQVFARDESSLSGCYKFIQIQCKRKTYLIRVHNWTKKFSEITKLDDQDSDDEIEGNKEVEIFVPDGGKEDEDTKQKIEYTVTFEDIRLILGCIPYEAIYAFAQGSKILELKLENIYNNDFTTQITFIDFETFQKEVLPVNTGLLLSKSQLVQSHFAEFGSSPSLEISVPCTSSTRYVLIKLLRGNKYDPYELSALEFQSLLKIMDYLDMKFLS